MHPADESPVNPLPPMVVALAVFLGGIELIFQAAAKGYIGGASGVGWRQAAIEDWGFNGALLDLMQDRGVFIPDMLLRFFSYAFIHANATHVIFVIVFLLALGKMVGERFGNFAVLAIFLGSAGFGALCYWLLSDTQMWLIGGMPGAYGMIGAYTFLLWVGLGALHQNQMRAFTLIGFLMGVQLLFGLIFGGAPDWIADLAGFAMGFALSFVLAPGGWAALVARMRRR